MNNKDLNYISISKNVFDEEINSLKIVKDNIDESFISAIEIIKNKALRSRSCNWAW